MTDAPNLDHGYENRLGTLNDDDIRAMAQNGLLITADFSEGCIEQACYELRASGTYYRSPNPEPIKVESGESIIIGPKDLVVIIVMETVSLPANMLGRILTKGQLFSLGLSSVNTYADPGFEGQLGIVFFNTSARYIRIEPGLPIAKMEFSKLERAVSKPYKGQHGYKTQLWPIKTEYYLKDEEVRALRKRKKLESWPASLERAFGAEFAALANKLTRTYRLLFLGMVIYMLATGALIVLNLSSVFSNQVLNLAIGVVGSLIASLLLLVATPR